MTSIEELSEVKDSGLTYVKVVKSTEYHKKDEIIDVPKEFARDLIKEKIGVEVDFGEYKKYQELHLKKIFLKALRKKKISKLKCINLNIDNYFDNAQRFYSVQPFFYDKAGIFWFWQQEESKYQQVDDIDVMTSFDTMLGFNGQTVNTKIKTATLEAVKRVGRSNIPKPAPTKWIQFKDKAYSLESGNIYDVTHHYFFTNPIPWELGGSDETPTMNKLFKEWVGDKYVETLYEMIAYCCLTDYPLHLIFCLVGCGRNGKSKFQGLLNRFIGKDNVCSTELDTLLDSRFESYKLYRKLVCVMGETNFGVLNKTSLLKKLTGQDLIGYEFKNKKPFDDYNYAKIIIASNSLPSSEDTSEGFYRRWMILDFPNQFPEGKDILKQIPKYEYNNLALKITKKLPFLLKNNQFTNQGTIEERKKKYIFSSNPLSFFIELACNKAYNEYMRYGELHIAYRKYLFLHKKRAINYKEFNDILALEGLEVQKTSKKIGDEWVNGKFISGVSLRYNWEEIIHKKENYASCEQYERNLNYFPICKNSLKSSHISHNGHKEEINLPCHICGLKPSMMWDDGSQGKPICELCLSSKEKVKEETIDD